MLYASLLLALVGLVSGQYQPLTLTRSIHWHDLLDCSEDGWYFDNVDPAVHGLHRDGFQDMTEGVCYRGEWSSESVDSNQNERGNLWAAAQWVAMEDDGVTPINNFVLSVSGRMFGFCDYEPSDSVQLYVSYQWENSGDCDLCGYDDNWSVQNVNVFTKIKDRLDCTGWTGELTTTNTDWLSEVDCTTGDNGPSCYWDYEYNVVISGGNRFELKWYADLNNGFSNEAWGFGDVHLGIVNEVETECCTGTRIDNPNKSCSAFGEQRNCENKGCSWSSAPHCQISCCRKISSDSKRKPECKTLSSDLLQCGIDSRRDCEIRMCDCNGYWNGLNEPEGDPCPPLLN